MKTVFRKDSVFLETMRFDKDNRCSYLFKEPVSVIATSEPLAVEGCFARLEKFIMDGYYAAGFVSYEAGFCLEDALFDMRRHSGFPLLWFGIYKRPFVYSSRRKRPVAAKTPAMPFKIWNLRPGITKGKYIRSIKEIKRCIERGDTYQVNFTFKYKFNFSGEDTALYEQLKKMQSVPYSALLRAGNLSILSLSPELFFRKENNNIEVRPMKGTFFRGRTSEEDNANIRYLASSLKDRSENVMIVDLLRNDLGRICRTGTVTTERLFVVEKYETILQMISVVKGALKNGIGPHALFKAIFPSGSVTGAPKISTMGIINRLENEPRNVYTGSIGFFGPFFKRAVFNVAIRTVVLDRKKKKGEMGVGSGIVYDSDPVKEYEECKLKARFLREKREDIRLIETMLWRRGKGYFLLPLHLERLRDSAEYFGFFYRKKDVIKALSAPVKCFKHRLYRVRLLLDKWGKVFVSYIPIEEEHDIKKVRFSAREIDSSNPFLYHKTTERRLYDLEFRRWSKKGYFDVIFTNEKNQVTEGAISNIIIKKGRFYYTPPVECGLLNGVFRRHIMRDRNFPLKEKVLYKEDIRRADEVYMVNSVRGMVRVHL